MVRICRYHHWLDAIHSGSTPQSWWEKSQVFCGDPDSAGPAPGLDSRSFQNPSCCRRANKCSSRFRCIQIPDFKSNTQSLNFMIHFPNPIYLYQEFRFQGHRMTGPLGRLVSAGKKGAISGNVQRDMMRSIKRLEEQEHSFGDVPWLDILGVVDF